MYYFRLKMEFMWFILLIMNLTQCSLGSQRNFLETHHLNPRAKIGKVYGELEYINIDVQGLDEILNMGIPSDNKMGYFNNFDIIMSLASTKAIVNDLGESIEDIKVEKSKDATSCIISNLIELLVQINDELDNLLLDNRNKRALLEHQQASLDARKIMAEHKKGNVIRVNLMYNQVNDILKECRGYYIYHWLSTMKAMCTEINDIDVNRVVRNGAKDYEIARQTLIIVVNMCFQISEL